MPSERLRPVVDLGEVAVVGPAHQANVVGVVAASEREGMTVVIFEVVTLGASSAVGVHEAASTSVAPVDGTPHRGRNMPGGRVGTAPAGVLPGRARPTESSGLQSLELLGDGLFDDRGEIAVRHFRAQECPKALELVA
jgi:hypothetical protein